MRKHSVFSAFLSVMIVFGSPATQAATYLPEYLEEPAPAQEEKFPRLKQARDLAGSGKPDEALALIDQVIADEGTSFLALELKGVIEAVDGRLDEAILTLTAAAEMAPLLASPLLKLGDVYSAKGENETAFDMYQLAYERDPTNRKTNQRLGLLYEQRGEFEDAIAYLQRGRVGVASENLALALPLARAHLAVGNPDAARDVLAPAVALSLDDAGAQRVLGVAAFGASDWELAEERLNRAWRLGEKDPELGVMTAEARRQLGDFEGATQMLDILLVSEGRTPPLVRGLAQVKLESGDLDAAGDLFTELANSDGVVMQDLLALGQIATIERDFATAVDRYNAVIAMAPDQPDGYLRLANVAAGVRDYEGALRVLDGGIAKVSAHPDLLRRKVLVLARLDRTDEATAIAEEIWSGEASRAADGVMLASLNKAVGEVERARSVYDDVLSKYPEDIGALTGQALLLAEQGDFDGARPLAGQARILAPDSPQTAYVQGWVLSQDATNRAEGIALLERASSALPDPRILLRLAQAHAADGDASAARQAARAALEISTEFDGADEAKALVE